MKKRIKGSQFRLNTIEYKVTDDGESNDTFKIRVVDNYELVTNSDKEIHLKLSRTVDFEPQNLFIVKVIFDVKFLFEQDENGEEYTSKFIHENLIDMLVDEPVMPFMVSLISNITSNSGNLPIITPLQYMAR